MRAAVVVNPTKHSDGERFRAEVCETMAAQGCGPGAPVALPPGAGGGPVPAPRPGWLRLAHRRAGLVACAAS